MSNQKKNGQNMLQWIIPTVVLMVVILFTLITYKADILDKEKNKRLEEYSNKAREMADYYSSEIYMIGQVSRMLSTRVSVDRDYFCDDNVNLLTSAVTQLNIDSGYILRSDGKVMNDKGVEAPSLKAATDGDIDVTDGSVDEYIVSSTGDCVQYVSASFAEGNIILKYTPKKISDLDTFLSSNAKTSTYMLVSSKGIILDSAGIESKVFKSGENLFKYLEGANYEGITKEDEFFKNLEQHNKGKVLITNKESVSKYFIYQPIGEYKTFVMISVDEKQIDEAAKKGILSTTQMFWKIVILILVFVAILLIISVINAANFRKSNRELKEQAETDLLTDLYNKVATETKIKEYLQNNVTNKKAIMFVLDIDNFKKINDTMGHAFGDEVLSTLGHQLKSEFRINDIIGRTGGDEFIILLKDLKDDETLKREAGRVATFFKNFKVGEYTKYSATASIGAVEIPKDGSDFEALYKAADKALYLAKKRGKNQMAFYSETKDIKLDTEKPVLKVVEDKTETKAETKAETFEKQNIDSEGKETNGGSSKEKEALNEKEVNNKPESKPESNKKQEEQKTVNRSAASPKSETATNSKKVVKKVVKRQVVKKADGDTGSLNVNDKTIVNEGKKDGLEKPVVKKKVVKVVKKVAVNKEK
ncbi:MAG: GGDEF domain-containing protein [Lachnospiraceae bacterium]|nr:GGDEF domain-containing protein [Lachnospiraceae bacterium]